MASFGEDRLVSRIFEGEPAHTKESRLLGRIRDWVGVGGNYIGDDCACLPGGQLISTDSLMEGTHFELSTTSIENLGWKCAAVNLSDIAAMAGFPGFLLLGLGLPAKVSERELSAFYRGFRECADRFRARIVGGDLYRSELMCISVTVLGVQHQAGIFRRSGARPGDLVVVTGDFGASAAGLSILSECSRETSAGKSAEALARTSYCVARHVRPEPRLPESWLFGRHAGEHGALMDASDGLGDALYRICQASSVGMKVDLDLVPVHDETLAEARRRAIDPLDLILYGGEDYELVGSLSPQALADMDSESERAGPGRGKFYRIGEVDDSGEISLMHGGAPGPVLDFCRGYQHFQEG